jgi:hypothetical protein
MRTFDGLVKTYPPDVQELTRRARAFVLDLMGNAAQESVDASGPYVFYSYAPSTRETSLGASPGTKVSCAR